MPSRKGQKHNTLSPKDRHWINTFIAGIYPQVGDTPYYAWAEGWDRQKAYEAARTKVPNLTEANFAAIVLHTFGKTQESPAKVAKIHRERLDVFERGLNGLVDDVNHLTARIRELSARVDAMTVRLSAVDVAHSKGIGTLDKHLRKVETIVNQNADVLENMRDVVDKNADAISHNASVDTETLTRLEEKIRALEEIITKPMASAINGVTEHQAQHG